MSFVTVKEAAEQLGLAASTIRRKAKNGEIEAKREGKSWLVRLPDSDESIEEAPSQQASEEDDRTATAPAQKPGTVVGSRSYWCGTTSDSPIQNINLAGLDFPAFVELIDHPEGSLKTQRHKVRGTVVHLEAKQVEAARDASNKKVVRSQGARTSMLNVDSRYYRKTEGDVPVGRFVFMIEVDSAVRSYGAMWRDTENPQPLIG
jgi:excisionase family DNA binding protein